MKDIYKNWSQKKLAVRGEIRHGGQVFSAQKIELKNTDSRQRFVFAGRFPSDLDSPIYTDLLADKDSGCDNDSLNFNGRLKPPSP